ncbi:hypothetical protein HD806DRAFT_548635 [Xylariaceae sp. AK1471]|nr:hypothetical protein HD806DRAFT_548635 [Xylariaceae sp. AK1471]
MNAAAAVCAQDLYSLLIDRLTPIYGTEISTTREWAFRLVNLYSGDINDTIRCELVQSTIGDLKNQYEALSYTWGDLGNNTEADVSEVNIQVQRMWAIYENASRVLVFLGQEADRSDDALDLVSELSKMRIGCLMANYVPPTPIYHLWSTWQSHQTSGPNTRPNAVDILYRFRGSQAFNPKDKVYSLYRLLAENPILAPDYGKFVQGLYKDVVRAMIESSGTLEVLSHHNKSIVGLQGLPTWCPDWTVMRGKRILLWPNQYQAAGNRDVPAPFQVLGDTLTLKGKRVDRIQWLRFFASDDFKHLTSIFQEIKNIELIARQSIRYAGKNLQYFQDAFRRTLVAARIREKGPNNDMTVLGPQAADMLWDAWSCQVEGKPCNKKWARWYNDALYSAMCGRSFMITEGGNLGLVDGAARVGDVVGVFIGGQVLFALHEKTKTPAPMHPSPGAMTVPTQHELVGEWYVSVSCFSGRV